MKPLRSSVVLAVTLAAGGLWGQTAAPPPVEPAGLASFRFGATWTDLRQQAIREYRLEKAKAGPDSWRQPKDQGKLYFCFQYVTPDETPAEKELVIDHYVVAGKEYEVHFVFDAEERFYAYRMIEIPSVDLKDYDKVVGERLGRWQGVFAAQFGPATSSGKLPTPQSLQGTYTIVSRWKFATHTASVGIFHRSESYNAQAMVQDDTLAAEEAARKAQK